MDPATEEVITEIADGTVAEATTAVGWHTRRRTPGPGSAPARAARSCVVPFDLMTERRRPWLGSSCSKRESASGRTERGRVRRGVLSLVRQGGRRLGGMIEHTPLGRTRSWSAPADRRLAPHHAVEFPGRHGHPTRSGRPSSGSTTTTRSPFNLEEVGEAAYHPLSRRPHHPNTTSRAKVDWSSPARKDWRARPRRRR